jgi:NAD(P)-dependent dehydrogenase (short-subunit alcohol dehydrogenase family)
MGEDLFSLAGKRVLVTGGGAGIGAAISGAAAAAGAAVAVNDLDPGRAEEVAAAVDGIAVSGDVATDAGAESVVAAAVAALGGLDGLVNNAGIVTMGKLADADLGEWRRMMEVNFQSAYLCSRAARSALADGVGAIVNLASIAAFHPNVGTSAYTTSKAAVVALTQQAALEWGPDGIRVNAIAPGMISGTNMTAGESDELRRRRGDLMPLRRTGTPADIAPVSVFLLSDASRYVTGQVLLVDGGWSVSLLSFTPRPWD